jgi:hypothetical protein
MKEERINIRVTAEEKKLLQEQASREGRSLSNYLIHLAKRENKKGGSEMDKVKYFTKARSTGEVGWAYIPKSWVVERPDIYLADDQNFIKWIEEEEKILTENRLTEIMGEEVEKVISLYEGNKEEFRISAIEAVDPLNESTLTEEEVRKIYRDWLEESIRA